MRLFEWIAWRRRRDDDLQQEIASHLAMAAHERIAGGEDPRAARLAAHREFGNIMRTREATRLTWSAAWLDRLSEWWRDIRYAARLLRKSPGYSLVVVAVLAVGIGTNLVAFGFYNAIALAPLSGVERSYELHVVMATTRSGQPLLLSHRDCRYLRDEDRTHRGLAATDFTSYALGIYGLVTYIVRQSTHEIGIRLALGAPRGQIMRRFLMRGLRLGGSGAAIGVAVSLSTSRLMGSLLYDVAPTDVLSFTAAAAAVLCIALAASLVPAWRAARLNPLTALRQ